MARLSVTEVCGNSRVTREDGARLREAVVAIWSDSAPVEVDFEGVAIASVSFFDEAFARLALEHPLDVMKRRLNLVGLTAPDRRLLNSLLQSRSRERASRRVADAGE
ncbi:MAG: STAS-like domain-containing protein [Polyangiales bacterium]